MFDVQLIHSGFLAVNSQTFLWGGHYENGIYKGHCFGCKRKVVNSWGQCRGSSKNPLEWKFQSGVCVCVWGGEGGGGGGVWIFSGTTHYYAARNLLQVTFLL